MKLKKERIEIFFKIFDFINKIVPKKEQIVLYSNVGFRDNVRSVYEYLLENNYNSHYKIICSVDDYKSYKADKENVIFCSNIKGIRFFLESKYVFYCFGKYPIMPSKKQIVVNMWHGMPLKKIGLYEENNKGRKLDYFSYLLATSDYFVPIMSKAFGCDKSRILINGEPKADGLFTTKNVREMIQKKDIRKIVLWLPTYRVSERLNDYRTIENSCGLPLLSSDNKIQEFNAVLSKNSVFCYVKLHPLQNVSALVENNYTNLRFINDESIKKMGLTLYELMSGTDALISDYSSAYISYLLLDRPIGFTVDDIEEYKKFRGFVVDNPYAIMPGTYINTYKELISFIEDVSNNKDEFKNERKEVKENLHKYSDGRSTKRLLEFCGIEM